MVHKAAPEHTEQTVTCDRTMGFTIQLYTHSKQMAHAGVFLMFIYVINSWNKAMLIYAEINIFFI